jgi:hypothetical protein
MTAETTAAETTATVRAPLARLKSEFTTLEQKTRERLKGTKVEAVANRVKAELPRAVETQVDALLDRAGLVRKAKVAAPAVVADAAVATPVDATTPVVLVEENPSCVGQVA